MTMKGKAGPMRRNTNPNIEAVRQRRARRIVTRSLGCLDGEHDKCLGEVPIAICDCPCHVGPHYPRGDHGMWCATCNVNRGIEHAQAAAQ